VVAGLSTRDGRSPIVLRRRDGVFRRPFVVVVGRLLINRVVDDVAATQHNSFRPASDGRTDSRSVVRRVTRRVTCFHLVDVFYCDTHNRFTAVVYRSTSVKAKFHYAI